MTSSYRVVDVRPEQRLAGLRDALGRGHVVSLNAEIPRIGCELSGHLPRAGHRALLSDWTGQVFDITTDAVACGESYMFERLHPMAPLVAPAPRAPLAA